MKTVLLQTALCALFVGISAPLLHSQSLKMEVPSMTTFDRLIKTVIPFTASKRPTLSLEPSFYQSHAKVRFDKTLQAVVFDEPVPAGNYTITLTVGKVSAQTTLRVLPSYPDSASRRSLQSMTLNYGSRLTIRSKLSPEASLLPKEQFSIDYQLGNEQESRNNQYSEAWVGPNIPAAARVVKLAIVWQYPLTGERVVLWTNNVKPEQLPPNVSTQTMRTDVKFDSASNVLTFIVRGIRLNTDVPLDADNSMKDASRSIKASLTDAEVQNSAAIDVAAPETHIETELIANVAWKPSSETLKLTESNYDEKSGEFLFTLTVSGLPQGITSLRGAVKIGGITGKIVNRKAGAVGSKELSVVVPIEWRR